MIVIMQKLKSQASPKRWARIVGWMSIDFAVILLAFSLAYTARSIITPLEDYLERLPGFALIALFIIACLYLTGVYNRIWSQTSGHGIALILRSVGLAALLIFPLNLLFGIAAPRPLPLSIFFIGMTLAFMGLTSVRYRSRLIGAASWRYRVVVKGDLPDNDRTRMLIVGAGEAGQTLAWRLKHRFTGSRYRVVGFVDDDPRKQGMYIEGCLVLGLREDIPYIVREKRIDVIVVAIHNISGADFREILGYCERTSAVIKVVPDMLALINARQTKTLLRDVQAEDLIGRSTVDRHSDVDLTPITRKVVLVTGAAGSIGSELSRQMASYQPSRLILLDNNESALHDLQIDLAAAHPEIDVRPVLADVARYEAVADVFETHQPEVVFHAAAYKHVPMLERYPNEAIRVNVGGTRNLTKLANQYAIERFVLISTDKAVNPSNVMGASKRLCEWLVHVSAQGNRQTKFGVVRFGNVLGSRGSVVPTFNRQIDNGGPVTITHKDMTRYFMSIAEAVNLVIHAACLTSGDDIFVLRMGEVVRIVDVAERMIRLRGLRPYEDIPISFIGMRPGEKLHEELHDELESPAPTIHPHIIRLENWKFDSDYDVFLEHVDRLLVEGVSDAAPPLEQLLSPVTMMSSHSAEVSEQ